MVVYRFLGLATILAITGVVFSNPVCSQEKISKPRLVSSLGYVIDRANVGNIIWNPDDDNVLLIIHVEVAGLPPGAFDSFFPAHDIRVEYRREIAKINYGRPVYRGLVLDQTNFGDGQRLDEKKTWFVTANKWGFSNSRTCFYVRKSEIERLFVSFRDGNKQAVPIGTTLDYALFCLSHKSPEFRSHAAIFLHTRRDQMGVVLPVLKKGLELETDESVKESLQFSIKALTK